MKPDHLVKILAEHGVDSRRGCERRIKEGEVTVDGVVQDDPAAIVDPQASKIQVLGDPLPPPPELVTVMLHKPKGVITTRSDPEQRQTVFDLLPEAHPALAAVGRLDYWTEGLLLLTTDGELAYRLTHPSYQISKNYLVKITGTPIPRKIKELERGVELEDGKTGPCAIEIMRTTGPSSWLLITIAEGRNRVIRRMAEAVGHRVLKLKRVGFAGLGMKELEPGESRQLTRGEIDHLKRMVARPATNVRLTVTFQVQEAVAEALRLPKPERPKREERVHSRDEEGRPFRGKGWARPKAKATKPGTGARKSGRGAGDAKGPGGKGPGKGGKPGGRGPGSKGPGGRKPGGQD